MGHGPGTVDISREGKCPVYPATREGRWIMDIKSITGAYRAKMYGMEKGSKLEKKTPLSENAANSGERVEISTQSTQLQNTRARIDALPEVRLEVVEEIKKRIEANDYPLENNMNEAIKKMIEKNIVP